MCLFLDEVVMNQFLMKRISDEMKKMHQRCKKCKNESVKKANYILGCNSKSVALMLMEVVIDGT